MHYQAARSTVKLISMALAMAMLTPPAVAETKYPMPTTDGRERIQRSGTCPVGWVGIGQLCEALHRDTPRAYPVIPGKACPPTTFRSGGACVSFR